MSDAVLEPGCSPSPTNCPDTAVLSWGSTYPQACCPTFRMRQENGGDFLRPHFDWFELKTLYDALKFTDLRPLLDYYSSGLMKLGDTAGQVSESQWERVYDAMSKKVRGAIHQAGYFSIPKIAGFFLLRKPGD